MLNQVTTVSRRITVNTPPEIVNWKKLYSYNVSPIFDSSDAAFLENHLVLSQCSCFIGENIFDLTKLLVQIRRASHSWSVRLLVIHFQVLCWKLFNNKINLFISKHTNQTLTLRNYRDCVGINLWYQKLLHRNTHFMLHTRLYSIFEYTLPFATSSFDQMLYYALRIVIPLQRRSCSVCMSFVRLGHHNG